MIRTIRALDRPDPGLSPPRIRYEHDFSGPASRKIRKTFRESTLLAEQAIY